MRNEELGIWVVLTTSWLLRSSVDGCQRLPKNRSQLVCFLDQLFNKLEFEEFRFMHQPQPIPCFPGFLPGHSHFVRKIRLALGATSFFVIRTAGCPATKKLTCHMATNEVLWKRPDKASYSYRECQKTFGKIIPFHRSLLKKLRFVSFAYLAFSFLIPRSSFLVPRSSFSFSLSFFVLQPDS